MANRPIFVSSEKDSCLVEEHEVSFAWNPGLSSSQKKKNVAALHDAAAKQGLAPLLEVSTKSDEKLGQRLSAFNLLLQTSIGEIGIESVFQGSKVFQAGGPYVDIYGKDSRSAKRDERLQTSGSLIGFDFFGQSWPLIPKTSFYDWIYISALYPHREFLERLCDYSGFTDIEFNPGKSINCQARTCALFVSLLKLNLLDDALKSQENFLSIVTADSLRQKHSAELRQQSLI